MFYVIYIYIYIYEHYMCISHIAVYGYGTICHYTKKPNQTLIYESAFGKDPYNFNNLRNGFDVS